MVNINHIFLNVSDRLLVAVRCGSEELGGSGENMGKLIGRLQPRQYWGLSTREIRYCPQISRYITADLY